MTQRRLGTLSVTAVAVSLATVVASSPSSSWAQVAAQLGATPGWYVTPSASLTEQYDDNVFLSSSKRESDFLTRITPGFKAGYHSTPFTLLGNFSFDSEIFAEHPELGGAANGKQVGLQTSYMPTQVLTLGLNATFTETQTPGLLNAQTGIEQGRARSTRVSASPTVAYKLTPLTTGHASYSYTTSDANGLTTVGHQAGLGLARQLTPVDTGTVDYGLSVTESDGASSTTSHTLTAGWSRRFTERTGVSLRAGPRFTEGAINPEINAELSHKFKTAQLALNYYWSESTLAGQAGTVKAQGVSASLTAELLKSLTAAVAPSVRQTSSEHNSNSPDVTVYGVDASVSYQLTRWLTANAAYHFTFQQQRPADIEHSTISIRFDVIYPLRVH